LLSLILTTEELPEPDPLTLSAATSAEGGAEGGAEESLEVGGGATYTVGVPKTPFEAVPALAEFRALIFTR
jgi:hypothetical protein